VTGRSSNSCGTAEIACGACWPAAGSGTLMAVSSTRKSGKLKVVS
jgi:hypothetical protein